jgi:hypothetical protein
MVTNQLFTEQEQGFIDARLREQERALARQRKAFYWWAARRLSRAAGICRTEDATRGACANCDKFWLVAVVDGYATSYAKMA